ncbi:MAG: sensor histidine kinase [Planctomycetota bacterium]
MRPTTEPASSSATHGDGAELSVRQLAHELSSQLDGALRCLSLASRRLAPATTDPRALANLQLARTALERMTELLETSMRTEAPAVAALASREQLGVVVARVVDLLRPMAEERGVALRWAVDEGVEHRPCGLLETVLVNAARNAIDAAARSPAGRREVDISIAAGRGATVELSVADSGTGPDPAGSDGATTGTGHGIGLELCRQIVAGLNGHIELVGAPYGGGTVLHVSVPLGALGVAST